MKILMLNYEFPPIGGGAGQAHLNLAKQYAQIPELDVDILTASETLQFRLEELAENVRIHRIGIHKKNLHYWRKAEVMEWLFKAGRYYKKLTIQNHYDLVHSFFAFPSGYLCLKTAGQIPYLVALRGSDVPGYNTRLKLDYILLNGLFKKIWRNADAVIANSRGLAELATKFQPDMNIGVICNGINTDMFHPTSEQQISSPIQLLTVCRLIGRKRIHLLIEALSRIHKKGFDAELNIVGEGNLLNQLQSLAAELSVSESVRFHGLIEYENLPLIYQQNHIFIMSSEHEGMSNAMLEAMASGLPIVTTPCEGVEELIDPHNGTVVYNDSAEAIAEAVCQLLQQQEHYKAMCLAARQKAMNFSWASTANSYFNEYKKILSK